MSDKLFQVVDNVHSTIYYSELEKEIMGTPFFNRLHDVNQSSTVYFTFPPNRTKRYEHSLGTMQVTSDVFYNSIINSKGNDAIKSFFKKSEENFACIFNFFHNKKKKYPLELDSTIRDEFSLLGEYSFNEVRDIIRKRFLECFSKNYLEQFIPKSLNDDFEAFLFLVTLQALRIVGMLHDCGHPPQSHIIETVLNEIYDELPDEGDQTQRQKTFREILDTYRDTKNEQLLEIDEKMAIKTEHVIIDHLHEMIGLQVIFNIFNNVLHSMIKNDFQEEEKEIVIVKLLYHLSLYEFVFATVRNKSTFWKSLHEIVDGVIDSVPV